MHQNAGLLLCAKHSMLATDPDAGSRCMHVLGAVTKLEWQSPLQIIKYPDPRLRAVNARLDVFDDTLLALAKEMIKIMYE